MFIDPYDMIHVHNSIHSIELTNILGISDVEKREGQKKAIHDKSGF